VIRMVVHWIQLWSHLLPMDQWEPIVTGCNQLLMVAQDFYFQAAGWQHTRKIANG
uniref:Uncharacterized protein n=1 Tax=Setaria italica TaxID=4555 RepID=K4AK05_SETIT